MSGPDGIPTSSTPTTPSFSPVRDIYRRPPPKSDQTGGPAKPSSISGAGHIIRPDVQAKHILPNTNPILPHSDSANMATDDGHHADQLGADHVVLQGSPHKQREDVENIATNTLGTHNKDKLSSQFDMPVPTNSSSLNAAQTPQVGQPNPMLSNPLLRRAPIPTRLLPRTSTPTTPTPTKPENLAPTTEVKSNEETESSNKLLKDLQISKKFITQSYNSELKARFTDKNNTTADQIHKALIKETVNIITELHDFAKENKDSINANHKELSTKILNLQFFWEIEANITNEEKQIGDMSKKCRDSTVVDDVINEFKDVPDSSLKKEVLGTLETIKNNEKLIHDGKTVMKKTDDATATLKPTIEETKKKGWKNKLGLQ